MSEAQQINRLREEQLRAVEQTKEQIHKLKQFKDDYIGLQNRLRTLPDKVSHEVMVPFGKLAFMPGKLIHTNEVLTLLGDNWFADRSAKQACDIIDRRIENVDSSINDLKQQAGLLEPRLDFTEQLQDIVEEQSDVVEIKEDYDEEAEKKWKEAHSQRMRIHKQREGTQVPSKEEHITDEELWARLDMLEIQEARNRELQKIPDDPDVVMESQRQEHQVHWNEAHRTDEHMDSDEYIHSSDEEYTDEEEEEEEEEEEDGEAQHPQRRPNVIHFTHSSTKPPEKSPAGTITSPADVVASPPLKSILKKSSQPTGDVQHTERPPNKAFSSSVVEHSDVPSTSSTEAEPPKRLSKFKAQRMQQKR